jgi:hypothetical protein
VARAARQCERTAPRALLVGVGRALLKHERAADAAKLFDVLVARNKRDAEAVALLIEACATCDPARAAELSTRLPALPPAVGFDIELELADSADATRLTAVAAQVSGDAVAIDPAAAAAAAKADAERLAKKRAHRRKYRKTLLPKGFDPANPNKFKKPDPERWIPKHLRTKAKAKSAARRAAARPKRLLRRAARRRSLTHTPRRWHAGQRRSAEAKAGKRSVDRCCAFTDSL